MGEFHDGLKNGFGRWRKEKATRSNMYEGQYFRDKKQGFGIFKWASGNMYRGQYRNDERDGIGEMRWTDGSIYTGWWERGIQHGYGRMQFPDGTLKEGLFENNVYKGPEGAEVPKEFAEGNFDVMELAPKEISFSEEMTTFAPGRQPATSYAPTRYPHPQRFMTASEDPHKGRSTLYSAAIPRGRENGGRTASKDSTLAQRNVASEKYGYMRETQSSLNAKSFSTSSRSLLQQVRPKGIYEKRKHPQDETTYGEMPAERQQRREPKERRDKRVWRPSGNVPHAESRCLPKIVMYH